MSLSSTVRCHCPPEYDAVVLHKQWQHLCRADQSDSSTVELHIICRFLHCTWNCRWIGGNCCCCHHLLQAPIGIMNIVVCVNNFATWIDSISKEQSMAQNHCCCTKFSDPTAISFYVPGQLFTTWGCLFFFVVLGQMQIYYIDKRQKGL